MTEPTPADYRAATAAIQAQMTPAELFGEVLAGAYVAPSDEPLPPPAPRAPMPNPAQGAGGNWIPDPNAARRQFAEAIQDYTAAGPHGMWLDMQTGIRHH